MLIIVLDPAYGSKESGAPAAEKLISGDPRYETLNQFESADGRVFAGLWSCTPGGWRVHYDETEYCKILSGSARLTSDAGGEIEVGPGVEFVIPAGFSGIWETLEPLTKRYVIISR